MDRSKIDASINKVRAERAELDERELMLTTLSELQEREAMLKAILEENNVKHLSLEETLKITGMKSEALMIEHELIKLEEECKRLKDELNSVENKIQSLSFIIDKNKLFDKTLLLSNIRVLLREQNKKIGQLETDVNVQPGYISRLEKGTNTSDPSVEFVVSVAKELKVPLDILVKTDLSDVKLDDWQVVKFVNKLYTETQSKKIEWGYIKKGLVIKAYSDSPLIKTQTIPGSRELVFLSNAYGKDTVIADTCFDTGIKNASLHLMNVTTRAKAVTDMPTIIELWMLADSGKLHFICDSRDDSEKGMLINMLYMILKKQERDEESKIDPEVANVMNGFLNM